MHDNESIKFNNQNKILQLNISINSILNCFNENIKEFIKNNFKNIIFIYEKIK